MNKNSNTLRKVLILEDDFIIQMYLSSALTKVGCKVMSTVDNGEDALRAIEKELPDLIFMDIGLPGDMDGVETANLINKTFQIPIVFITGNSDPATHKRAMAANPIHIIFKPIAEEMLKEEFNKICDKIDLLATV